MRLTVVLLVIGTQTTLLARSIQENVVLSTSTQDTVYYVSADQMPEPIGGLAAISRNLQYPLSAKKDRVEGTVYVEVFLDEEGNVLRAGVIEGVRSDLDAAAIGAISKVRFTGGTIHGRPIKVRVTIPIRFKLGDAPPEEHQAPVDRPTVQIVEGPSKLKELIQYPQLAILAGIQGQVFVNIILDDKQELSELKVIRGIGAGCENAVLRALATYGFPIDTNYRGKTQMELPVIVNFRLPTKK